MSPYNRHFIQEFCRHYGIDQLNIEQEGKRIAEVAQYSRLEREEIRQLLLGEKHCVPFFSSIKIKKFFQTEGRPQDINLWSTEKYLELENFEDKRSSFGNWIYSFMKERYIPIFRMGLCKDNYIWELLKGERKIIPGYCSKDFLNFLSQRGSLRKEYMKILESQSLGQ